MSEANLECCDALKFLKKQETNSVQLVIGSPPYYGKFGRCGLKELTELEWISFMLNITKEAVRVSKDDVIWIANGGVEKGEYIPVCEGLIWNCYQSYENEIYCERPVIWSKNAPPNRKNWFANNWEFCLCFRKTTSTERKVWQWERIAEPPKYKAGGHFRQRNKNGERVRGSDYPKGKLTRPKDILRVPVGGGLMGSKLACENTAPFPEKLVEPFILALTNPGDVVADVFVGSGSVAKVALKMGRRFIGCDIDPSAIELSRKRLDMEIYNVGNIAS